MGALKHQMGEAGIAVLGVVKAEGMPTKSLDNFRNNSLTGFFYDNFPGTLPYNFFADTQKYIEIPDKEKIRSMLSFYGRTGTDSLMKSYDSIIFMACYYSDVILEYRTGGNPNVAPFLSAYLEVAIEENSNLFDYMVETFPRRVHLLGSKKGIEEKNHVAKQIYNLPLIKLVRKVGTKLMADGLYSTEADLYEDTFKDKYFEVSEVNEKYMQYTDLLGEKEGSIMYLFENGVYELYSERGSGLSIVKKKDHNLGDFSQDEIFQALENLQSRDIALFNKLFMNIDYNQRVFRFLHIYNPGRLLGVGIIFTEKRFISISEEIKENLGRHAVDTSYRKSSRIHHPDVSSTSNIDFLILGWARGLFPDRSKKEDLRGFKDFIYGGKVLGKDIDEVAEEV